MLDVRDLVAKNVEDKEKMEESVHQRKAGESRKKHAAAVEVRSLQKQPAEWTVAQLKAMVSYKKMYRQKTANKESRSYAAILTYQGSCFPSWHAHC